MHTGPVDKSEARRAKERHSALINIAAQRLKLDLVRIIQEQSKNGTVYVTVDEIVLRYLNSSHPAATLEFRKSIRRLTEIIFSELFPDLSKYGSNRLEINLSRPHPPRESRALDMVLVIKGLVAFIHENGLELSKPYQELVDDIIIHGRGV